MRYEKLKVFVVVVFKRHRVYAVISDRSSCVRCSVQTTMTRRQVDPQVADRHLSSSKYSVEMRPTRPGQRHSIAEMLLNSCCQWLQQLDPFENWGQNPRGGGRFGEAFHSSVWMLHQWHLGPSPGHWRTFFVAPQKPRATLIGLQCKSKCSAYLWWFIKPNLMVVQLLSNGKGVRVSICLLSYEGVAQNALFPAIWKKTCLL